MRKGGSVKIFRREIFLSQCRKILQGNSVVQCFRNFPVVKKVTDKGGGSRLSVEKFLSHKAEKCRRGIIYCFTNFRFRKMLGIKEMGKHQDFPPKIFCLIVPNIL